MSKTERFGIKKNLFSNPVNVLIFFMGATAVALIIVIVSLYFAHRRLRYLGYLLPAVVNPCSDIRQAKTPPPLNKEALKAVLTYQQGTTPLSDAQVDGVLTQITPFMIAPKGSVYKDTKIHIALNPSGKLEVLVRLDTLDQRPPLEAQSLKSSDESISLLPAESVDEYKFDFTAENDVFILKTADTYLIKSTALSGQTYTCALALMKMQKDFLEFIKKYPDSQFGLTGFSQPASQPLGERLISARITSKTSDLIRLQKTWYTQDFVINPWKQEIKVEAVESHK